MRTAVFSFVLFACSAFTGAPRSTPHGQSSSTFRPDPSQHTPERAQSSRQAHSQHAPSSSRSTSQSQSSSTSTSSASLSQQSPPWPFFPTSMDAGFTAFGQATSPPSQHTQERARSSRQAHARHTSSQAHSSKRNDAQSRGSGRSSRDTHAPSVYSPPVGHSEHHHHTDSDVLSYASHQSISKAFMHVSYAHGAYLLAASVSGPVYESAKRAFEKHTEKALKYASSAKTEQQRDPDSIRKRFISERLGILEGEFALFDEEKSRFPTLNPQNPAPSGIRHATLDLITKAGQEAANLGHGFAYGVNGCEMFYGHLTFKSLQSAYEVVGLDRYGNHPFEHGIPANPNPIIQSLFQALRGRVHDSFNNSWRRAMVWDAAAFSFRQSLLIIETANDELKSAYHPPMPDSDSLDLWGAPKSQSEMEKMAEAMAQCLGLGMETFNAQMQGIYGPH